MNSKLPNLLISKVLDESKDISSDELKEKLYKLCILTKKYDEDNMILLYTKFNSTVSDIQNECKSIVIDSTTKKILSYSCPVPILNNETDKYFNDSFDCTLDEISTSYEGTFISLFYNNDKWYLTTRRIIKTTENLCKYCDEFNEVILKLV